MDEAMLKCLRRPFPEKEVQIKPGQGGLKYISHGSVTARLLDCDPLWSSEILEEYRTPDEQHCLGVKMALTIGGHTRIEVGGTQRPGANIVADLKNCYSDALKRCAMRFGVALEMWEHLIDSQDDEDYGNTTSDANQGVVTRYKAEGGTRVHDTPQTKQGGGNSSAQRDDPVEASLASGAASQRQLRYMQAVGREAEYDAQALDELAKREFGVPAMALSRKDASALIDIMQTEHNDAQVSSPPQPKAEVNGQPLKPSQDGEYNWQDFWTWARSQNLPHPAAIEAVIGKSLNGMTPNQIRDAIVANTADPNPPEASAPPVKTSSKQEPDDPNSVLPTKRREEMIKAIFEHTRGQITATDLNNLCQAQYQHALQRITIAESRALYTQILNANTYELTAQRDDLRRQKQPITDTLMKKLWAVVGKHTPAGVEKDNYLHVQLFEHLGLGSVKDMSTYDVDKMISVYEGQDFLDPEPVGDDEPPY